MIVMALVAPRLETGRVAEGPVTISRSNLAERFRVSRPHVRRVINRLRAAGVEPDDADPRRLILTPRFRANYELYNSAVFVGMLNAIAEL
jgi:DNA-binding transcriptional regulator LsrR (DeoR family)